MKRAIKGAKRAAHIEREPIRVWAFFVGLIVLIALSRAIFHY